jgi:phosphoadenosine phosphosulfate reductase
MRANMPEVAPVRAPFDASAFDIDGFALRLKTEATRAFLAASFATFAGRVALVSSFGADSIVLLHLAASIDPSVPVLFVDTGRHFPETLGYVADVRDLLRLKDLRSVRPDAAEVLRLDPREERAGYDPDGCCDLRKVQPLAEALAPFAAWVSGRKRFQADTRAALPAVEREQGKIKLNPLADWNSADLEAYRIAHDLPQHPLAPLGYPSIGCAPCTSRVAPGEDPRAGRWRGLDKVECGIHAAASKA